MREALVLFSALISAFLELVLLPSKGYWVQNMDKCTKFSVNLKAYDLMAQHQAIFKCVFLLSKNVICF